jgi:uncharacterized glyoxalase superfamily protein PhnB
LGTVVPSISPYLFYEDVEKGFAFLLEVFGLEKIAVQEVRGRTVMAQAGLGPFTVVVAQARDTELVPARTLGGVHSAIAVMVDDVDAHHARARQAGATIWAELSDKPYGVREYGVRDTEGNLWFFATPLKR